jgi:hypothetical protein
MLPPSELYAYDKPQQHHRLPGGGGGGNENNPPPPEGLSLPNKFVLPPDFPTFFPSFPGILIVNVCPSFKE